MPVRNAASLQKAVQQSFGAIFISTAQEALSADMSSYVCLMWVP